MTPLSAARSMLADRGVRRRALWLLAASGLFLVVPRIDVWAAELFWNGDSFWAQNVAIGRFFAGPVHRLLNWVYAAIVLACAIGWMSPGSRVGRYRRGLLSVTLTVAIAVGLIGNVLLKDHWGRARPSQTVDFQGTRQFTPIWVIGDQCARNCSFVNGDGSMAAALAGIAWLVPAGRWRRPARAVAVGLAATVALMRMANGSHYAGDTIVGVLIVALSARVLDRWIGPDPPDALTKLNVP